MCRFRASFRTDKCLRSRLRRATFRRRTRPICLRTTRPDTLRRPCGCRCPCRVLYHLAIRHRKCRHQHESYARVRSPYRLTSSPRIEIHPSKFIFLFRFVSLTCSTVPGTQLRCRACTVHMLQNLDCLQSNPSHHIKMVQVPVLSVTPFHLSSPELHRFGAHKQVHFAYCVSFLSHHL